MRVAAADRLVAGSATEWATDPAWAVEAGQFGMNGLVHVDGVIYAANTQHNSLSRVTIEPDGTAGAIQEIALDRTPSGLDGLEVAADGSLIFVEGYANSLTRIALGDQDDGALTVLDSTFDGPTTFALFAGSAWVAEGQLDHFFAPDLDAPQLPFRVVRFDLDQTLAPR